MLKTRTRTEQTLQKNIRLFQHHNQTNEMKDKLKQHQKMLRKQE